MAKITDTSKQDPLVSLGRALLHGPGGGDIESQEAKGQRELVASSQLPLIIHGGTEADLEAMGIELGPRPTGDEDPLFRDVVLPEGWAFRATEHNMWSEVIDGEGKVRLAVFYKAAFYDRRAHVTIKREEDADPRSRRRRTGRGLARWVGR